MPLTGDAYSTDLAEIIAAIPLIGGTDAMFFTYAVRPPVVAGRPSEATIYVASVFKASEGPGYRVLVKDRLHERVSLDDAAALERWIRDRAGDAEGFHGVIREVNRAEAAQAWKDAGRT